MFPRHYLLVIAASLLAAAPMSGTVLGSFDLTGVGLITGKGVLPPQLPLVFSVAADSSSPCFTPSASCSALLQQTLTTADIGSVFKITGSSPGFSSAAVALTDAVPDTFSFALIGGAGAVGIGDGTGFLTDTISEIDLTIRNVAFEQVQLLGPGGLVTFTQADLDVNVTVQGTTPEPSSALLIGSGLIMAAMGGVRRLRTIRRR